MHCPGKGLHETANLAVTESTLKHSPGHVYCTVQSFLSCDQSVPVPAIAPSGRLSGSCLLDSFCARPDGRPAPARRRHGVPRGRRAGSARPGCRRRRCLSRRRRRRPRRGRGSDCRRRAAPPAGTAAGPGGAAARAGARALPRPSHPGLVRVALGPQVPRCCSRFPDPLLTAGLTTCVACCAWVVLCRALLLFIVCSVNPAFEATLYCQSQLPTPVCTGCNMVPTSRAPYMSVNTPQLVRCAPPLPQVPPPGRLPQEPRLPVPPAQRDGQCVEPPGARSCLPTCLCACELPSLPSRARCLHGETGRVWSHLVRAAAIRCCLPVSAAPAVAGTPKLWLHGLVLGASGTCLLSTSGCCSAIV